MSKQDSILFSKKGGVGDVSRIITLLTDVLMLILLLLLIVTEIIAIWFVYVNLMERKQFLAQPLFVALIVKLHLLAVMRVCLFYR